MKQRCPLCESWSAEGTAACSCGHQFVQPGFARLHRAPVSPVDPSLVTDLGMRSRKDIRNGAMILGILLPLTIVVLLMGGRVGFVALGGLFWAGILIIRGLRLRGGVGPSRPWQALRAGDAPRTLPLVIRR